MKHIASVCLFCMSLVTCADVVGRLFGRPLFGSEEIVAFLAVLVVGFSLPYAHYQRSHIGIDLAVRVLPSRVRRLLSAVVESVAAVLFGLVAWRMFVYGQDLQVTGRLSMNLGFPEHIIIYLLGAGFTVFAVHLLCDGLALLLPQREEE